jgi:tetratricopeptide (TPR) repeat protein
LALPLLEETLNFRRAKLGPDHPDTLTSMNNLAAGYRAASKLELALPLCQDTLKRCQAKLGPEDPNTLDTMNQLAVIYWQLRQLDKSIPLFEEASKRQETKLGRDHPDTMGTVANLGVNYKDAGRVAEALPLLEEAYRASKKYPKLRFVGVQLLNAYYLAGKNELAAPLLKELHADARTQLPKESTELAGQLGSLGSSLLRANLFTQAEPFLRESLAICEKKEPEDWRTFDTKSMLGGALLGQKKYADAEPLLLAGYEGMKHRVTQIPPRGKLRFREAAERLVQLYEVLDKKDEAAKWKKELEKLN